MTTGLGRWSFFVHQAFPAYDRFAKWYDRDLCPIFKKVKNGEQGKKSVTTTNSCRLNGLHIATCFSTWGAGLNKR
jgi:hypothetical protein